MSHSITGTNISLTRGDSLFLQLELTKNGEPYTPEQGCSIRFAMKESYKSNKVLIKKQIPLDTLILELDPMDTKPLPMGRSYVYDFELTDEEGHVDTFIEGKFNLTDEVD